MNQLQIATLVAMHSEIGFSTNAHIPLNSIHRHFPRDLRGFCKKTLKELIRRGLVNGHPTGGSTTYSLSKRGIIALKEILEG